MTDPARYKPSKAPLVRAALKLEAERRVRAGELRVNVARDMCLPLSTMAVWAAMGGWRGIDLEREAAGLPPLPRPYYARADRNVTAGSKRASFEPPPRGTDQADKQQDLKRAAEGCGRAAHAAFEAGDLAAAEEHLRAARRYMRLEAGLAAFIPPEKTAVGKARARIDNMTTEDLRNEIRRLAGLPLKL